MEKIKYIKKENFFKVLQSSYLWLNTNKEKLNKLNVFPVPDGDTGFNMASTVKAGIEEIDNVKNLDFKKSMEKISEAILLSSSGNSGIIISQFFEGFSKDIKDDKIDAQQLIKLLKSAKEYSYKSVKDPVEGTILTIINTCYLETKRIVQDGEDDLYKIAVNVVKKMYEVLEKTPEMLPKLAQAGVIDAGALGFIYLIEGFTRKIERKNLIKKNTIYEFAPHHVIKKDKKILKLYSKLQVMFFPGKTQKKLNKILKNIYKILDSSFFYKSLKIKNYKKAIHKLIQNFNVSNLKFFLNFTNNIITLTKEKINAWTGKVKYRYCTEFIIRDASVKKNLLEEELNIFGNSIIIVYSKKYIKVHIHTNMPDYIIKYAGTFGKVDNIKIDDMEKEQKILIKSKI